MLFSLVIQFTSLKEPAYKLLKASTTALDHLRLKVRDTE